MDKTNEEDFAGLITFLDSLIDMFNKQCASVSSTIMSLDKYICQFYAKNATLTIIHDYSQAECCSAHGRSPVELQRFSGCTQIGWFIESKQPSMYSFDDCIVEVSSANSRRVSAIMRGRNATGAKSNSWIASVVRCVTIEIDFDCTYRVLMDEIVLKYDRRCMDNCIDIVLSSSSSSFPIADEINEMEIMPNRNDDDWRKLNFDQRTVDYLKSNHPVSKLFEFAMKRRLAAPIFVETTMADGCYLSKIQLNNGVEIIEESMAANSKKMARFLAAAKLIDRLIVSNRLSTLTPHQISSVNTNITANASLYDRFEAAIRARLIDEADKNDQISKSATVFAGIVLYDETTDAIQVVSWATGNRSIRGTSLSHDGTVVNDCHAEVVCRRGLMRFLCEQINKWQSLKTWSIFNSTTTSDDERLQMRDNLSFHMFISTAPCGDGRLFFSIDRANEHGVCDNQYDVHRPICNDRRKEGLLRAKIESGEGTIPVVDYSPLQTPDGILGGERLRTMSCSDKLLKWNVVGIQGALLSRFIRPIYLASLSIGTLFIHGDISRAVCCRASQLIGLPPTYRLNHPILSRTSRRTNTSREMCKSSSVSANWNAADNCVELIDGPTGVEVTTRLPSRLCKRQFFCIFQQILSKCDADIITNHGVYYAHVKSLMIEYVETQRLLYSYLVENGMGQWLRKPMDEKMFSL